MKDEWPVLGKLFFTSFTELCKGFLKWLCSTSSYVIAFVVLKILHNLIFKQNEGIQKKWVRLKFLFFDPPLPLLVPVGFTCTTHLPSSHFLFLFSHSFCKFSYLPVYWVTPHLPPSLPCFLTWFIEV